VRSAEIGAAAKAGGFTIGTTGAVTATRAESLIDATGTKDLATLKSEFGQAGILGRTQARLAGIEGQQYDTFDDAQAPNAYSNYGDLVFDTLLASTLQSISKTIDKTLLPTYSYYRLYVEGNELIKHIDRSSCKISSTLCLGYDVSNVDQQMYNDYNWAMWAKGYTGEETAINLQPGDMIIYRGDQIEHWREKFLGLNHAQVFLHYNESDDPSNMFDGRMELGLPKIL
jgi:hypothetical protein